MCNHVYIIIEEEAKLEEEEEREEAKEKGVAHIVRESPTYVGSKREREGERFYRNALNGLDESIKMIINIHKLN